MKRAVVIMAVVGVLAGGLAGLAWRPAFLTLLPAEPYPLPHQVSKYPGGIALRFAMVHDVVHERFAVHGKAYYEHRNRVVGEQLRKMESEGAAGSGPATRPSEAYWRLLDDLAVGLVHLGEYDRAVGVMREKLSRQERAGIEGAALYSTYANLGTAMMIGALHKLPGGGGTDELRESLVWVRKSIEVNPQAHFGREEWQVALGEYLLKAQTNPNLLLKYDMIGNRLGIPIGFGGSGTRITGFARDRVREPVRGEVISEEERRRLRDWIVKVGGEGRVEVEGGVPFDEPVLGIVGMWRYGAGANVHFSLALAETMVRVGQRYIAWSAYERTARLAEGTMPGLVEHARKRQGEIEKELPAGEAAKLRPAFEGELKKGLEYQAAYQAYESARLAAGGSIDDPDFYDEFFAKHGGIASEAGDADEVVYGVRFDFTPGVALGVLGGGVFGFGASAVAGRRGRAGAAN